MISSERMHKPDKLAAIQCGDIVTYQHEGAVHRGEVHGFKLDLHGSYEHRVLVGGDWHSREVSLRSIIARERKKGAGSGTVTF